MVSHLKFHITILDMTLATEFKQKEGTFKCQPDVEHHFSDGLYAKEISLPKGYVIGQHAHKYSHLSVLAKGKVLVETDDWKKEYSAPACIDIKAETYHKITTIEDTTWFCIHATEETDLQKIDEVLIQRG